MAVVGILTVGVRRPGGRQRDADLPGETHGLGGRPVDHLEVDEVPALGPGPAREPVLAQSAREDVRRGVELRRDHLAVPEHVRADPLGVAEEACVRELVDLVRADRTHGGVAQVPVEVLLRGRQERHPGPGEGDLGGRADLPEAVGVPGVRGQPVDVRDLGEVLGERVDDVGVVPHDPEVGRRRGHPRETGHRVVVVHRAGGVGEDRDTPDALDGRVGRHETLDLVHVRAGGAERNGDHLEAEPLGDAEVAVVAGHRAQPAQGRLVLPGAVRVGRAEQHGEHEQVVHDRQAGVVLGDHPVGLDAQELGEDRPQLGQSGAAAVVAHVGLPGEVVTLPRQGQHALRQVELLGRRLPAGEVQCQAPVRERVILGGQSRLEASEFVGGEIGQRHGGLRQGSTTSVVLVP